MIQAIADPCALRSRIQARVVNADGCWVWQGAKKPSGYGNIYVEGRYLNTHRAAYMAFVGPIPDGLTIDHLCRNRSCVNPDHLEPVTHRENTMRGDSPGAIMRRTGKCRRGHRWGPDTVKPNGQCRECQRLIQRRYYARSRGQVPA